MYPGIVCGENESESESESINTYPGTVWSSIPARPAGTDYHDTLPPHPHTPPPPGGCSTPRGTECCTRLALFRPGVCSRLYLRM